MYASRGQLQVGLVVVVVVGMRGVDGRGRAPRLKRRIAAKCMQLGTAPAAPACHGGGAPWPWPWPALELQDQDRRRGYLWPSWAAWRVRVFLLAIGSLACPSCSTASRDGAPLKPAPEECPCILKSIFRALFDSRLSHQLRISASDAAARVACRFDPRDLVSDRE